MTNSTIVGSIYIVMGIFGIAENGLAAVLIATDREMRNPTYIYMVNVCLSDVVTLTSIAIYSGVVLIYPSAVTPTLTKLSSYVTATSWCFACQFIVLMTFSRYVQLKWAHKMHYYFSRRNLIITVLVPWLLPVSCFSWLFGYDWMPFRFFPELGAWQFDDCRDLGRFLSYLFMALTAAIAFTVNFLNIRTLLHVHRIRKQVHTIETNANAAREIKLFVQCAITGTSFTVAVVAHFVISALKAHVNTAAFVVSHCMWILNALQYPLTYFALNSLLRERFLAIFCGKKPTPYGEPTQGGGGGGGGQPVKLKSLYVKEVTGGAPLAGSRF